MEMVVFHLMTHSDDAKSSSLESIKYARKGDFEKANMCLEMAEESLSEAHKIQSELMKKESKGSKTEITLLLIHAENCLGNSVTIKELAYEMVHMCMDMQTMHANG